MSLWVIPDIHGRADLLNLLLVKLGHAGLDLTRDKLIFLGDMIDRGPESKAVINRVRALTEDFPKNVIALAGNHEYLAIDACRTGGDFHTRLWMHNGGDKTLSSYGTLWVAKTGQQRDEPMLPLSTITWLESLPLFHEEPGFFFSHAPVPTEDERHSSNKGQPFTKDELIWTFHSPEWKFARVFEDRIGVCGHVHQLRQGIAEPRFYDHYIFADAGAGCAHWAPLVAIEVKSRTVLSVAPVHSSLGVEL